MGNELSRDIINGYRAWDALEFRLTEEAKQAGTFDESRETLGVIDIDVAPDFENPLEFASRTEVQAAFVGFLERSDDTGMPHREYIQRRLGASLLHSRLKDGEQIDFYEQIQTTMNVGPELVEESEIDDHQQKIDDLLKKHGLRFQRSYKEKYEAMLVLGESGAELQERLLEATHRAGRLLLTQAGFDGPSFTSLVKPEITEIDAAWVGYFGTENRVPVFRMNTHPRHKYTAARIDAVAFHEGAHAQDFMDRRAIIRTSNGRTHINPLLGLTTLHTPEMLSMEVYALGHEQIGLRTRGARNDGWQYLFQAECHDYQEKVWNNAHIRINTGGNKAALVEYVANRLPFEEHENIEARLQESHEVPETRAYCAVYEPAMKIVRRILATKPHSRSHVLNEIKRRPYTEYEIRRFLPSVDERNLSVAS